jgi:hypothetical protein
LSAGPDVAFPHAKIHRVRRVGAGAGGVDLGLSLDAESSIALPLIARALTGDPHGLARPQPMAPWFAWP